MGHDRERAAMIYQHKARGADKSITDAIDDAEAAGSGRSTGQARPMSRVQSMSVMCSSGAGASAPGGSDRRVWGGRTATPSPAATRTVPSQPASYRCRRRNPAR